MGEEETIQKMTELISSVRRPDFLSLFGVSDLPCLLLGDEYEFGCRWTPRRSERGVLSRF